MIKEKKNGNFTKLMSRENFDNDIRDIVASYSIVINRNFSQVSRDLGVSRQTIRRIIQGDTKSVSQNSLDTIAENFAELEPWKRAKTNFGADVVSQKVWESGNRKDAYKQLKQDREKFNEEIRRGREEWKDLTNEQKSNRGRSPDGTGS